MDEMSRMSPYSPVRELDLDAWTVPNDWAADAAPAIQSSSKCAFHLSPDLGHEPQLIVVRQPEEQHRARYLSEGSRGAIKDRSGASHCTIQLIGYYRPTRVEIYAGSCSGPALAHQLYELIPVSGKGSSTTPCKKMIARDGIQCLEVVLRPENNMTAVLDCVGILKICSYDMRRRSSKNSTNNCAVRLVFRAYIPFENGTESMIEAKTEPIRCVQQLGVPEVLKMSLTSASAAGGTELFIIGRNFDRNSSVLFREYEEDGALMWSAEATVQRQFLHQCHIVCTVPQYHNMRKGGTVSLTVRCGPKSSHPMSFQYLPYEEVDDWRPPSAQDFFRKQRCQFSDSETQSQVSDGLDYATVEPSPTLFHLREKEGDGKPVVLRKRSRLDPYSLGGFL